MKTENDDILAGIETAAPVDKWAGIEAAAAAADDAAGLNAVDVSGADNEQGEQGSAADISSAELMTDVVMVSAAFFAPNWQLKPEECEALGGAYGALLDKYLPDNAFGQYGVEISAILVTGAIIRSRAGMPLKIEKEEEKDGKKGPSEKGDKKAPPVQVVKDASPTGVL